MKNTVSVGASETTYQSTDIGYVAYYSSIGPTYDGRIKPDIIAPGSTIQSARSNANNGQSCSVADKIGEYYTISNLSFIFNS